MVSVIGPQKEENQNAWLVRNTTYTYSKPVCRGKNKGIVAPIIVAISRDNRTQTQYQNNTQYMIHTNTCLSHTSHPKPAFRNIATHR